MPKTRENVVKSFKNQQLFVLMVLSNGILLISNKLFSSPDQNKQFRLDVQTLENHAFLKLGSIRHRNVFENKTRAKQFLYSHSNPSNYQLSKITSFLNCENYFQSKLVQSFEAISLSIFSVVTNSPQSLNSFRSQTICEINCRICRFKCTVLTHTHTFSQYSHRTDCRIDVISPAIPNSEVKTSVEIINCLIKLSRCSCTRIHSLHSTVR